MKIRTLTVKPEYALKIASGEKIVENRNWTTKPGWLAIHAGAPVQRVLCVVHIAGLIGLDEKGKYVSDYDIPLDMEDKIIRQYNTDFMCGWVIDKVIPVDNAPRVPGKQGIWYTEVDVNLPPETEQR